MTDRKLDLLLTAAVVLTLALAIAGCPAHYREVGDTGPDYTLIDCDDPRVFGAIPDFCKPR